MKTAIITFRHLLLLIALYCTCCTLMAQIPTMGEVYNFDIGDRFHYRFYGSQPPAALRRTVIAKEFSADGDSVTYTFAENNYSTYFVQFPTPHLEYIFSLDTTHMTYAHLDSLITSQYEGFQYDTTFYTLVTCGQVNVGYDYCIGDFEPDCYRSFFAEGYGQVNDYRVWTGSLDEMGYFLIYASKADGTCGTPDLTTAGVEQEQRSAFNLYPNPTDGKFTLQRSVSGNVQARVLNRHGQVVATQRVSNLQTEMDLSHLSEGLYFVEINGTLQKLMVQKR